MNKEPSLHVCNKNVLSILGSYDIKESPIGGALDKFWCSLIMAQRNCPILKDEVAVECLNEGIKYMSHTEEECVVIINELSERYGPHTPVILGKVVKNLSVLNGGMKVFYCDEDPSKIVNKYSKKYNPKRSFSRLGHMNLQDGSLVLDVGKTTKPADPYNFVRFRRAW